MLTNRRLTREVDLIEEIVRVGWGDIEATLPAARNHAGGLTSDRRQIQKDCVRYLTGLNETKVIFTQVR